MKCKDTTFKFRLTKEEKDLFQMYAKINNITLSELIIKALENYIIE